MESWGEKGKRVEKGRKGRREGGRVGWRKGGGLESEKEGVLEGGWGKLFYQYFC